MKKLYVVLLILTLSLIFYIYKTNNTKINQDYSGIERTETNSGDDFMDDFYLNPNKTEQKNETGDPVLFPGSTENKNSNAGYIDKNFGLELQLETPKENQRLKSPFLVSGFSTSDFVIINVINKNGNVLIDETAKVLNKNEQGVGKFSINITYLFQSTKEGYVIVKSPDTEHKFEIPVYFD